MQPVPAGWIDSFNREIMGEQFIEVELDVTDPDVFENATVTVTGGQSSISDASGIVGTENVEKYGTLETDLWLMDGSFAWADAGYVGYVGSLLSNTNGTYSSDVEVDIDVGSQTTTSGITIEWGKSVDEYPTEFEVVFYSALDSVIHTETVTNNTSSVSVIAEEVEDYSHFTIKIIKWCLPNRRPRIERVVAGIRMTFTKFDMTDFVIEQSVNPISAELPLARLSFSITNATGEYSIDGSSPLEKYLKRMQKLTTRLGITMSNGQKAYINGGTFWLDTWDFPNGGLTVSFTARDAYYFMNRQYIYGLYRNSGITMADLAEEVLTKAADIFPVVDEWEIPTLMSSYSTIAPLPVCTYAECLQYIAQACGMILKYDRNGKIIFSVSSGSTGYTVTNMNCIDYPQLSLNPELQRLECTIYNYDLNVMETDSQYFPDIDGDGRVTIADVQEILSAAANIGAGEPSGLTPAQEKKADADRDGMITAADAVLVQQFVLACSNLEYTNDVNGWGLFINIALGNKEKIHEAYHDIIGTETILITHSESAEVNVQIPYGITLDSVSDYTNATEITLTADPEQYTNVLVKAYGYPINISTYKYFRSVNNTGDVETIANPLITNKECAGASTQSSANWMQKRNNISLPTYRADPRLDAGDTANIGGMNATITDVRYAFTGMFKGTLEGRVN